MEREYRRRLSNMVDRLSADIEDLLVARIPQLADDAQRLRPDRADSWADDVDEIVNQLRLLASERVQQVEGELPAMAAATANFNRAQLNRITNSVLGVDVFLSEPWLADELASFAKENATLIKSLAANELDQIEGIAQRGLRSGARPQEVSKEIKERFGVTKRRANLIARDQVAKLNGQLTQLRQKELNIQEYVWRTSGDERVRESHRSKDGKRFRWDNPPAIGHPGEDFQCRCYAEPVMDDLIG